MTDDDFGDIPIPPISDEELKKANLKWDNAKTKKLLGFEFIPLEKSVVDAVKQLLDAK